MNATDVRSIVATIEGELEELSRHQGGTVPPTAVLEVRASFARLVALLDLGPQQPVRHCPSCNRSIMRAALRCGFCWAKLVPAAAGEA